MAREDFLLSVRTAARDLAPPHVWTDSPSVAPEVYARILKRAALWLTKKAVEGFDPADFPELAPAQRDELRQEVECFLAIAKEVPPAGPANPDQIREARAHLEKIVAVVRDIIQQEWLAALEKLVQDAESWSAKQGWAVQRDRKKLTDDFLGSFAVPVLLIHTPQGRCLLDPIARFIVGGRRGRVDLCRMPSYDSVAITRNGEAWYVHSLTDEPPPRQWSEATFVETVRSLIDTP